MLSCRILIRAGKVGNQQLRFYQYCDVFECKLGRSMSMSKKIGS
jgi:hypothetical protein